MNRISFALIFSVLLCVSGFSQEDNKDAENLTQTIQPLIRQTGADDFKERETATKKLIDLSEEDPELMANLCLKEYAANDDPEVRQRLTKVLRAVAEVKFSPERKAFLGIGMGKSPTPVTIDKNEYYPIIIQNIIPASSAEKSGLHKGDKIISIDDKEINRNFTLQDFGNYIGNKKVGDEITISIFKDKKKKEMKIKLGKRPPMPGDMPMEQQKKAFIEDWMEEQLDKARKKGLNEKTDVGE